MGAWCKCNVVNRYIALRGRATFCLKRDCKSRLVLDKIAEVVNTPNPAITLITSNLPDLEKEREVH